MIRYSVQPRDRMFVKAMEFNLLLKICVKILAKIPEKTKVVNIVRIFFIMLNNLQQMHLKLIQKE